MNTSSLARILQVMYPLTSDGVTQVVMNYGAHLDPQRVQMDFLFLTPVDWTFETQKDPRYGEILARGGRIYHLPKPSSLFSTILPQWMPRTLMDILGLSKYQKMYENFFKEHPYRVVHCHLTKEFRFIMNVARDMRVPCRIIHSHNCSKNASVQRKREFMLWWQGQYAATHFWGCSQKANVSRFGAKLVREGRAEILSNAIDCVHFGFDADLRDRYRKALGIEERFVVGHVGRYAPQKNQSFLITVFESVLKQRPNSVLLLVGQGKDEAKLRSLVHTKNLSDKVIFITDCKDSAVYYSAMDCFVLPSVLEGLGIVAIEAQCNGLPVVLSSVIPEEADVLPENVRRCSLLDSPEAWAEKILSVSPAFARVDAAEMVSRKGWDISVAADRLTDFYASACRGGHPKL